MTKAKDIEVYHVTCPKCGKLRTVLFKEHDDYLMLLDVT